MSLSIRRSFGLSLLAFLSLPGCQGDAIVVDDDDDDVEPTPQPAECGEDIALEDGMVHTSLGVFRGVESRDALAWLGIPFAEPPTADRRWKPPASPVCSTEIREADAFGPLCPQPDEDGDPVGQEDCLHLNVWTPREPAAEGEARPVMFFIHGGGNIQGGTGLTAWDDYRVYDGAELAARRDVVVVTTNYRLGALGFLVHEALGEEAAADESDGGWTGGVEASGNYGLMDQILALQWVRANAEAFGGDRDRVMLFGQSAGAVDTCALMTSPRAEGLFSRAAIQSGGCLAQDRSDAEAAGAESAATLGCSGDAPLECLRSVDVEDLVALSGDSPIGPGGLINTPFRVVEDEWILPDVPLDALDDGTFEDVPLLIGSNAHETGNWVGQMTAEQYENRVRNISGALADTVLAVYPVDSWPSPRWAWIALTSDSQLICPSRAIARAAEDGGDSDVFRYFFVHRASGLQNRGAYHGLELAYVFQRLDELEEFGVWEATVEGREVEEVMGAAWAAFAHDADPSTAGLVWPAYSAAADNTQVLGGQYRVLDGVRPGRCDFWDSLIP